MGEPSPSIPSYIFTIRHGARLDAADSTWHLTSATPYDPPLTYGGWLQGRSLGYRIASILNTRNVSPTTSSVNLPESKTGGTGGRRKKQTRIIIHTSPFLRCIQTSIAIGAGVSMYWNQQQQNGNAEPGKYIKSLLRVDAWLGEWLTPDYFTEISPPPETALLAGTSKVDLMRPSSAQGMRPGPPSSIITSPTASSPLNTLPKDLTASLPQPATGYVPPILTYAVSPSGPIPRGHVSHAKEFIEIDYPWDSTKFGTGGEYGEEWATMHKRFRKGYKQMLMWYAAEDREVTSCKTSWRKPKSAESKRSSLITGRDGGSSGVSSSESTPPRSGKDTVSERTQDGKGAEEDDGDIEVETVVILVTHGAGCNALIGAMTDKPVLMDIGLASMTMAERVTKLSITKPPLKTSYSTGIIPPPSTCPAADELSKLGVSYDVKLVASTEHLRKGSMAAILSGSGGGNSPKLSPGTGTPPPSLSAFRNRYGAGSSSFGGTGSARISGIGSGWTLDGGSGNISPITENGLGLGAAPDSVIGRGAGPRRSSVASISSSTGLWSRPVTANANETGDGEGTDSSASSSRRNSSAGMFIDKERLNRGRGGRDRSFSNRVASIGTGYSGVGSTSSAGAAAAAGDEEVAAESGESDDGAPVVGLWGEKKRRWTMDQANRA